MDDSAIIAVARKVISECLTLEQIEEDFRPDTVAALLLRSDFDGTANLIHDAICKDAWPNQSRWGDMAKSDWIMVCRNAILRERIYRKVKELFGK